MERIEKINTLINYFDDVHYKIIETMNIQGLIIDVEVPEENLRADLTGGDYGEPLTDKDVDELVDFLEGKHYIIVSIDDVSGVSFDNCEVSNDVLEVTDLWKEDEEEKKIQEENEERQRIQDIEDAKE